MSGNNHFLLGLESDNQIFDEVCGYWKNQCTQQPTPLVPLRFCIDDKQLPQLWSFGRMLRPQRCHMDSRGQKRIVQRWETEVIFENCEQYIVILGHYEIIIQMGRSGCDKHPGTLFLLLWSLGMVDIHTSPISFMSRLIRSGLIVYPWVIIIGRIFFAPIRPCVSSNICWTMGRNNSSSFSIIVCFGRCKV